MADLLHEFNETKEKFTKINNAFISAKKEYLKENTVDYFAKSAVGRLNTINFTKKPAKPIITLEQISNVQGKKGLAKLISFLSGEKKFYDNITDNDLINQIDASEIIKAPDNAVQVFTLEEGDISDLFVKSHKLEDLIDYEVKNKVKDAVFLSLDDDAEKEYFTQIATKHYDRRTKNLADMRKNALEHLKDLAAQDKKIDLLLKEFAYDNSISSIAVTEKDLSDIAQMHAEEAKTRNALKRNSLKDFNLPTDYSYGGRANVDAIAKPKLTDEERKILLEGIAKNKNLQKIMKNLADQNGQVGDITNIRDIPKPPAGGAGGNQNGPSGGGEVTRNNKINTIR